MATGRVFDADDLDLLEDVLGLVPNLTEVAFAGKLARERLKFPVRTHRTLDPLFGKEGALELGGRRVSSEQTRRYIPQQWFPIESVDDLVRKLLLAFHRRDAERAAMAARAHAARPVDEDVATIPAPVPLVFGPSTQR
ncbi:MAG TPA: hypothetical protein VJT75_13310 [Thermoleophilaceae bacterium]|nr:hypothetical protein [Thermoleophilaceae bacterium]